MLILGIFKRLLLLATCLFPRSKNLLIFGAWFGNKYSDNSRSLFLYALENTEYKCVWITSNKKIYTDLKEKKLPVAMKYSLIGIYYQLRAFAAFSCTGHVDFCKPLLGNCIHVGLWHGVGGGKKVGYDDKASLEFSKSLRGRVYAAMEKYPLRKNYMLATSNEMQRVFTSAFKLESSHFIKAGQPRNDMFYDSGYEMETISPSRFNNKKVVLYMPTHRKEGKEAMDMSLLLDLKTLNEFCVKNDIYFVIKKHFYHLNENENLENYSHILDITKETFDSNELLILADYLISDYSSVTADYLLLDRPIIYYCYDYDRYIKEDREMYWEYEDITPGYKAKSFDELLSELTEIVQNKNDKYINDRVRVRNMFYSEENQTFASKKIIDFIRNL